MWPPNLLPPIGFLSLATYISNYSDGRKEGRKKFKGKREGEERNMRKIAGNFHNWQKKN